MFVVEKNGVVRGYPPRRRLGSPKSAQLVMTNAFYRVDFFFVEEFLYRTAVCFSEVCCAVADLDEEVGFEFCAEAERGFLGIPSRIRCSRWRRSHLQGISRQGPS